MFAKLKLKAKKYFKKFALARFVWRFYLKFKGFFKRLINTNKIKRHRPAIIQMVPSYNNRDAIGIATLSFSQFLLEKNIENYIVYLTIGDDVSKHNSYQFFDFSFCKNDIVIFHLAIGSPLSAHFKKLKVAKKIIIYHNITPSHFFTDNLIKSVCDKGRDELKSLATVPDLSICDSNYNKSEMDAFGYKNTYAVPLPTQTNKLISLKKEKEKHSFLSFITVGRIAPNKCVIDVVKTFIQIYSINKNVELFIIGKKDDEFYFQNLINLIKQSKLSKHIHIVQYSSKLDLAKYYSNADGYICMSEHEGFCVPLVEAMAFGVPIFAYNSTAVGETAAGASILFANKDYKKNAQTILDTLKDKKKVSKMISHGFSLYENKFNNKKNMEKYLDLIAGDSGLNISCLSLNYYLNVYNYFIEKVAPNNFPLKLLNFLDDYEKSID